MSPLNDFWTYLSAIPLPWLTATVVAYLVALRLAVRLVGSPLADSVLIAGAILVSLLLATGTPYHHYFESAQFVHFLLGPATVALAIPLYKNLHIVKRTILPMVGALLAGSSTAVGSAVATVMIFNAPADIVASIAPNRPALQLPWN